MTYQLRDRPDGQLEIVVLRAEIVGTFADRTIAAKVMTFLQEDDAFNGADAPAEEPPGLFGPKIEAEAATVVEELLEELPAPSRPPPRLSRQTPAEPVSLPAVVAEKPRPPVQLRAEPPGLTDEEKDAAFQRLTTGAKLAEVAPEFGLTTAQLRGMWSGYRRRLQNHFAGGGQVRCRQCSRVFLPSLSHPDTCARCSRE